MAKAQVHRFLNNVAIRVGNGKTIYVSPKAVKAIAKALNKAARSCETEEFSESTCGTFSIVLTKAA